MNNKNSVIERLSGYFETFGGWCFDNRWIVVFFCILVLGICAWGASQARFDNSFEAFFDRKDPTYDNFLKFRDDFGSDEISYILYEVPGKTYGPWDIDVMRKIEKITHMLEEEVPFIKRVISLANVEFMEGVQNDLVIHDLLLDFPKTQEDLLKIRDKVIQKPIYENGVVSRDGRYAAIIIEMDKSSIDPMEEIRLDPEKGDALDNLYPQASNNRIRDILAQPEFSEIKFYHSGDVPLNAVYNEIVKEESLRLGIISFIVIGVLLFFFFRSFLGVVAPIAVVFLAILVSTAFIGLSGWSFDLMFQMLPSILIAVGVADAVHILSEFQYQSLSTGDTRHAIRKSIFLLGMPCLFTSVTTIAGFASMSISPIKAIMHFAVYSAIGVFGAFLLTITLLLAILSFKKTSGKSPMTAPRGNIDARGVILTGILERVTLFDIKHKGAILIFFAIIFVISAFGIARLKVDSNFLTEFSKDFEIRRITEFVDNVMGGTASISYVFDTKTEDGIMEPAVLREIEALQQMAEKQPIVMKTYSIVDLLKDINMTFHNEDPAYYVLPETRELVAQYLLLYEMSGGDELENYVTTDYAKANLELRCKMVETSQFTKLVKNLDMYLAKRPAKIITPGLTGMGALWIRMVVYIVQSQIAGFILAYTVIAIMMCLLFKSFKIGMIAMIPNLSPVAVTLGAMGWAGVPLDYVKLLIGCVAIGIAVDDTIHLIMRYHHEFRECGDYAKALKRSMNHIGRALFITTIVLVAGFLVFMFSVMDGLKNFGTLVASTIGIALIADFYLLPALVLTLKPFGPEFKK